MRARLSLPSDGRPLYVVGDVHGAIGPLRRLEATIAADAARYAGRPLLVMLGDLIDRGPHSAQVLDHVATPHERFDRVCLAGNHELVCADYLAGRVPFATWEAHGGTRTLMSLGVDPSRVDELAASGRRGERQLLALAREAFGPRRIAFLDGLPTLLRIGSLVMVHAGLRPGVPLADQSDVDLTTIRDAFFARSQDPPFARSRDMPFVVHGHTPVDTPFVGERRINVDTQAWSSGRLTALRAVPGESGFLHT